MVPTEKSAVDEFSSLFREFQKLGYIDGHHSTDLTNDFSSSDSRLVEENDDCTSDSNPKLYGLHIPCSNLHKDEVLRKNPDQSNMVNIREFLDFDEKVSNHRIYCSKILKKFGDLMVSHGDFCGAMSAFEGALEISEDMNKKEEEKSEFTWHPIHLSICDVHIKRRDWKSLRNELEKKVPPTDVQQNKENMNLVWTLQRLGDVCRIENNIDESMKFYSDAFLLLYDHQSKRNKDCATNLMQRIGDLNFIQNRYETAKDYYLEALRLGDPRSEEVPVSTILHKLALALNKLECNEEALKIHHQAALLKTNENKAFENKNRHSINEIKPILSSSPFNEFDIAFQKMSCLDMLRNISRVQKKTEQINKALEDKITTIDTNDEEKKTDHFLDNNSFDQHQVRNNKPLNRVLLSSHPRTQSNQRVRSVKFSDPIVDRVKVITKLEKEKIKDFFYCRQDFIRFRQEYKSSKCTSNQSHLEFAATFLESVGRKRFKEGSYDLAIQAYARALRVKTEVLGNDHISTSDTILKIGDVYLNQGNFTKSLNAFDAALKLRKKALGECHLSVSMTYNKMGIVYDHLGEIRKAICAHGKALKIRKSILGSQHILVASSKQAIGLLHFKAEQFDSALNTFQETLKIQILHFGSQKHMEVACTLISIGDSYFAMDSLNLALKTYEKALEIIREDPMDKDDDIACILNNIGSVYIAKHDYKRAIRFFGEALISIRNGSNNSCVTIKLLNNFADTLAAMGEKENASIAYSKVINLKKKAKCEEKEKNPQKLRQ